MSLHTSSPVFHAVTFQDGFTADGSGIKEKLCSLQCHTSCRFREPLIPADSNSNGSKSGIKNLKAGISRCEIEFFLIIMVIRNMCFPVNAEILPICIQNRNAVISIIDLFFIKTDRDHNPQLCRYPAEMTHCRVFLCSLRIFIILISALLAEIGPFKKLRKKNNLSSLCCCLTHQFLCMGNIFLHTFTAFHLNCCHRYISHPVCSSCSCLHK